MWRGCAGRDMFTLLNVPRVWGSSGFQTHTLQNGWHTTGDYGFLANGELFVIGRLKDIVIVAGNNIYPEDVETVINALDGVYQGRVVAFGVEDQELGTQSLAVVAEMKAEFDKRSREIKGRNPQVGPKRNRDVTTVRNSSAETMDREKHSRKDIAKGNT